jgi:nitroimidazol reductase NimA-like FMN-containing flavoprotein (pyridoxamine 5'-phosphate oxidase superfamily)
MGKKIPAIRAFLNTQLFGVLATVGVDGPHTNIITYAITDNLEWLIFSTPIKSRKFNNILTEPRIAFFIDNRPLSTQGIATSIGVTVKGTAEKIASENLNSFSSVYLKRHPGMKHFLETSGNALLGIRVKELNIITDLNEVEIVKIS